MMSARGSWKKRAVALAIGLGGAMSAMAAEPLRVAGRPVLEMAPLLLAAEKMPAGSVTVEIGGIPQLWAAPGTKPVDLAGNAETQALRNSVKHPDLRIILTATEGLYRVVARKSSGIQDFRDLRGKRVATKPDTSAEIYLTRMLARAGMTLADVTLVPLPLERPGDVLINGTADAIAYWEPEPERARQALGDDATEFNEFGVYREVYNVNATAATLADPEKRRAVVAYVRALIGACREATYAPGRAQALIAKYGEFDPHLVEASWEHHRFPCNLPLDLLDVLVEEEKLLAAKDKRPPRDRAQLATLIDPSILAEARAAR